MSPRLIEIFKTGDYELEIAAFREHNRLTRALYAMVFAFLFRIERVHDENECTDAVRASICTKHFREEFQRGTFDGHVWPKLNETFIPMKTEIRKVRRW